MLTYFNGELEYGFSLIVDPTFSRESRLYLCLKFIRFFMSILFSVYNLEYGVIYGLFLAASLSNLVSFEILRNLMEEKQLDFNAPILSVRRFSSTAGSSEGEDKKRIENALPKSHSLPTYISELKSGPASNQGTVPFLWERIPGRCKDGGGPQPRTLERPPIAPKLPPGRIMDVKQQPSDKEFEDPNVFSPQTDNTLSNFQKGSSLDEYLTKLKSSKEGMKEKGISDSEDSDDVYSDALDTLSRSESFFLNCSVSGVSGLDGPDIKPCGGTFSKDPQTRDFMMDRFLPAAKAMASETPQYASRKLSVAREQAKEVKKVVSGDGRPPVYRFPGMKVRNQVPISSFPKVSTHAKPAYAGSHSETQDKHTWDAIYRHKLVSGLQPPELHEDESKLTSQSNHLTYSSDSQAPDGSSPYRRLGGTGISPYRNEAPQSPFNEGMGFLGIPEEIKNFKANGFNSYNNGHNNFQEILFHQCKRGSGSVSPTVEKTLYVDSVHVEIPKSNSSSSYAKGLIDSQDSDFGILVKSGGMEEAPAVESSLLDINSLYNSEQREILQPKISEAVAADLPSSSDRSNLGGLMDRMEGFTQEQGLNQVSWSLVCSEVPINGNLDSDNQQPLKADNQANSCVSSLQSPLPPPLPKSPSESWLWRTLPSISSKNPSSKSYLGAQFHPRKQALKTSSVDPKWETIVKSSNMHHGHLRFSEELIIPISQQGSEMVGLAGAEKL
ncbi:hypothetical protein HHK36_005130 [Tetracentron sinense]|uniref:Uncharacterized protein n=1 Tax=Tetracentron sinense TaxID=13715 RepID=A0A834ZPT4_TETSI|nr:hypothetical protein HHK36_005130 [Tetracentron sinense]